MASFLLFFLGLFFFSFCDVDLHSFFVFVMEIGSRLYKAQVDCELQPPASVSGITSMFFPCKSDLLYSIHTR